MVDAEANDSKLVKHRYDDIYAVYSGPDRIHLFYAQRYTLNGETAYCIEPGVSINTDTYSSTTEWTITGLDNETINYIKLVAYYGYDYKGHDTMKYYLASQGLIWKKITGKDTYWVKGANINGEKINIDNELNEINSLISTHTVLPSFNNKTIELDISSSLDLKDESNVLDSYEVTNSNLKDVFIDNNHLKISTQNKKINGEIKLTKKSYTDTINLIYYNGENQKLIKFGKLDTITASVNIKTKISSKIKLIKIDADSQKQIKVSGLLFKIKSLDTNDYICISDSSNPCIYVTKEDGTFITESALDEGSYQIEELAESEVNGYTWNKSPLLFKINEDAKYTYQKDERILELTFENKQVYGSVELEKVGEKPIFKDNELSYEEIFLDDVVYNLYAKDNIYSADNSLIFKSGELVNTIKIINGHAKLDRLYLGNYCLVEVSTATGFILDDTPYCFTLDYIDKYTENVSKKITLKNYLVKGIFDFTKTDISKEKTLHNTLIEIYKENGELIFSKKTDKLGKIIIDAFPYGRYYFVEKEAPEGYILNQEKMFFEIKENGEIVKANMVNELIKVPNTSLNKTYYIYTILLSLMTFGVFLIIYGKKSQK